ncbi:CPBP family intramembrane glutamic endopeptidase [Neobacillus sp. FSL H8-0543]|uniref:CPBP family intramembrane glutamic endopeptidase n=1 Tax=Neobacillus sp. FSL H8-0543 TaxID=2954672 RepID=UPI003157FC14
MNKSLIIISISFISCLVLYGVEQILMADYFIKTGTKIVLFVGIPLLYFFILRRSIKENLFNFALTNKKDLKLSIGFGLLAFSIIFIAFWILQDFIDLKSISSELQEKSNITPSIFLFVALYVTFGNSFLEEFFFRGFIFVGLYKQGMKKTAYIFSSLLFSVYHMAIFVTWFEFQILLLALLGLFVVGFLFNWLNRNSNSFINSWIVHLFADIAIIIIGFRMFGMI